MRTHKLITWYWWRTSTRHLYTSALTTSASFGLYHTSEHKGVRQEQFSTQVMFKNSHKKHILYIWKPISVIDWKQHYEEIGQVAWIQKATWVCPPFGITPDLCNCKGKPLFEWVNIVIMELLWNHAFLTRRADFSPHIQIAIFISVTHELTKVLDRQTCSQSREDSLLSKFPSERHSMSACFLTVSLSVSVSRTCTRKLTQALSLTEQGLFGYDFNPSFQH